MFQNKHGAKEDKHLDHIIGSIKSQSDGRIKRSGH